MVGCRLEKGGVLAGKLVGLRRRGHQGSDFITLHCFFLLEEQ